MTTTLDNVENIYPLVPMQQGMLFHAIAAPGSGVFIDQITCLLQGELDVPRFTKAWAVLVQRHAALRTAFLWDGLDQPLQVVRESVECAWHEEDIADLSESERADHLQTLLREDRRQDFDLADAPLLRMKLLRVGRGTWRWIWTFHHLILDGWSAAVLMRELLEVYDSLAYDNAPALEAAFKYEAYVAWHAQQDQSAAESYWREVLGGFQAATPLSGRDRAATTASHDRYQVKLSEAATDTLRSMCVSQRVTLSAAVQAAWAYVLSRWSREDDVVFGVTSSGRPPQLEGIENAVGLFISTMPMRTTVDSASTWGDWLRVIQQRQLEMREVEYSGLAPVQRWSDLSAGQALFESIVVFENYPQQGALRSERLTIEELDFHEQSNYPLAILVLPGPSLELTFVYDSTRLHGQDVSQLADHTARVLERCAADPDEAVGQMSLVDGEQQQRQLIEWNDTAQATSARPRLIHELFQERCAADPQAIAAVCGEDQLAYGQLEQAANTLAQRLVQDGVGPDDRVGLLVERSLDLVVGILGILKAGAAYVPLDPSYPADYLQLILEQAAPEVVVAPAVLMDRLPATDAARLPLQVQLQADDPGPPTIATEPQHLAYVIFTSGSTGRPKGVMVSHANLLHSTTVRDAVYGDGVGVFLLLSSFAFDSSVAGIFWTLCSGGTLVLPQPGEQQDVTRLAELIQQHRVTHLLCLPTLYGLLLDAALPEQLGSISVAMVAGEACGASVVRQHFKTLPSCILCNEYGPTEATVWSIAHRMNDDDGRGPVPIGRPIPNTRAYLLDEQQRPVPVGFDGELYLAGAGVARGYVGDEQLTAKRFVEVTLPGLATQRMYRTGDLARYRPDGTILFRGRVDAQIKVRGHRIEAAAVESVLREQTAVEEAAVTTFTTERGSGGRRTLLVGYVVPAGGQGQLDSSLLAEQLRRRMPAFMVPDTLVVLGELPRTSNGKVDYRRLPEPNTHAPGGESHLPPRNRIEETLVQIWSDLLGAENVGIRDNFFQLGGDSILTIQLISRARQQGLAIEPRHIASHPTIEQLATVVHMQEDAEPTSDEPLHGPVELSPIQRWFFELDLATPGHWNQSVLLELSPELDVTTLEAAWAACWAHHDMLRARFPRQGMQEIVALEDTPATLSVVQGSTDIQEHIAKTQSSLDLQNGPLVKAVVVTPVDAPSHLALIAHHLVVDAVSWSILIDDLELACKQTLAGQAITLPVRTTPFPRWSSWLKDAADQGRFEGERQHWSSTSSTTGPPLDHPMSAQASEATARRVSVTLGRGPTASLLVDAQRAYNTNVQDLLVAALARTLARWVQRAEVCIELESHGRPDDLSGIDLSRTLGWFTTTCPLTLETQPDDARHIKSIKETLRGVPGHGLGFGVLCFLSIDPLTVSTPQVLFNYLGQARPEPPGTLLKRVSSLQDTSRDPRNQRTHPLEINAIVREGELVVDWIYSERLHQHATIRQVAGWFEATLGQLIDHCCTAGAGGFTPSDFPEADMDQSELDDFLDSLES